MGLILDRDDLAFTNAKDAAVFLLQEAPVLSFVLPIQMKRKRMGEEYRNTEAGSQ